MSIEAEERPSVTFVLFAYNQERFIRQAVEAMTQTYSPLQVILSDDCSSDKTFEIMCECAENYFGPHEIVLNRNEKNLGVAEHINSIMKLAKGEFIVVAAGDDISRPDRTAVLVAQWLSKNRPVAICSGFISIDDQGVSHGDPDAWYRKFMPYAGETSNEILQRLIRKGVPALVGATEAWSKELLTQFMPLNSEVWFEDNALSFRAWLMGGVHYLPDRLVAYRQHKSNISNRVHTSLVAVEDIINLEKRRSVWYKRRWAVLAMHQCDLNVALDIELVENEKYRQLSLLIAREMALLEIRSKWWESVGTSKMLKAFRLLRTDWSTPSLRWVLPRLLPLNWFARAQLWRLAR
jgi:cellulose synthase/poly-beta-1,6-N-acetylglucosamine synthase-like glycosyltransferase